MREWRRRDLSRCAFERKKPLSVFDTGWHEKIGIVASRKSKISALLFTSFTGERDFLGGVFPKEVYNSRRANSGQYKFKEWWNLFVTMNRLVWNNVARTIFLAHSNLILDYRIVARSQTRFFFKFKYCILHRRNSVTTVRTVRPRNLFGPVSQPRYT